MTWNEIGKDHLHAAKRLLPDHPRSAASRAYYAAHVLVAEALITAGYAPPAGRETQPHQAQAKLISLHLIGRGQAVTRDLKRLVRRLYAVRQDADYRRNVDLNAAMARDSVRDAATVFVLLGVR